MFNNNNFVNSYPDDKAATMKCGRNSCVRKSDSLNSKMGDVLENNSERMTYGLTGYPLASVYAPLQSFVEIYDCETGIIKGTIFSELDFPFICGGIRGGNGRG